MIAGRRRIQRGNSEKRKTWRLAVLARHLGKENKNLTVDMGRWLFVLLVYRQNCARNRCASDRKGKKRETGKKGGEKT